MGEEGRPVPSNAFVEPNASHGIAQYPRQRGLGVEEPAIARFLAAMLDQIVEDCSASRSLSRRNCAIQSLRRIACRNNAGRQRLAKSWAAFDHGAIPAPAALQSPPRPRRR